MSAQPPVPDHPIDLTVSSGSLEQFICEYVEPQLNRPYRPQKAWDEWQLLAVAARRKRMRSNRTADGSRVFGRGDRTLGGFKKGTTTLASDLVTDLESRRSWVKEVLSVSAVPVPAGKVFPKEGMGAATEYLRTLNGPAVVKPDYRSGGRGSTADVRTDAQLQTAWNLAGHVSAQLEGEDGGAGIVVEQQHTGYPVRVYVVGERVVAAVVCLPFYVVGDGSHTVEQLVDQVKQARSELPQLTRFDPQIAARSLESAGIREDEVLPAGKFVQLRHRAGLADGGTPVDVSDRISQDLKDLAVSADWALPRMSAGQVELICPSLRSADGAVVSGINSRASILPFHYPVYGKPRAVAEAMIQRMIDTDQP